MPTPCLPKTVFMADFQDAFTAAVLNADLPVPDGLICPDGRPASKRFDVYRNNVIVSLVEALGTAYPTIRKLVGENFFAAMAQVYVRANPPKSPLMMFYGGTFPDFLAGFEPVAHLTYLPDVARLERARREVYHAADDTPQSPEVLAQFTEAELLAATITPIAAMRIITSSHPIASIRRFNMTDDQTPVPAHGEDVMVARPGADVTLHILAAGSAAFITALADGQTLARAAEIAATQTPEFDLSVSLGEVFSANIMKQAQKSPPGDTT